jgi:membrane protein required for colicin V production
MNWADWVIIGILLVSCFFGLIRGFVREALSLIIWILAALGARIFTGSIEPLFASIIDTPSVRTLTAFLCVFIVILLLGALVQYFFSALIKVSGLSFVDRTLGIAFGVLRAWVLVMILLLVFLKLTQVHQDPWWRESQLIPFFLQWSDVALSVYSQVSDWLIQLFGVTRPQSI